MSSLKKVFFSKLDWFRVTSPPPQFSAPILKRQFSNYYMRTVSISYSVLGNSVKHPVDGKAFSHLFMYVSMNCVPHISNVRILVWFGLITDVFAQLISRFCTTDNSRLCTTDNILRTELHRFPCSAGGNLCLLDS